MATPRYLPVDTFKLWWKSEITADNALIEAAINAAETAIDKELGRRLIVAPTPATARVYRPDWCSRYLHINDATEITSVVENGVTLTAGTDYILEPLNGLDPAGEAWPYERLVKYSGWWYTDGPKATVTVTAKWGWAAIPFEVVESCKIVAADMLSNRDMRNGLVAITEAGGVGSRQNQTVREMIRHYKATKAAAGIAG